MRLQVPGRWKSSPAWQLVATAIVPSPCYKNCFQSRTKRHWPQILPLLPPCSGWIQCLSHYVKTHGFRNSRTQSHKSDEVLERSVKCGASEEGTKLERRGRKSIGQPLPNA